jgi:hypothetical protein
MTDLTTDEQSICSLVFAYEAYDLAIRALDSYGDEKSAYFLGAFQTEWEKTGKIPDLSHNTKCGYIQMRPNRDEVLGACSGLISAYDNARESLERSSKLQLRRTIEALFDLRALSRLKSDGQKPQKSDSLRDILLSRQLATFPLSSGQITKLKNGGYHRLGDLFEQHETRIMGLCGMTQKQVENVDAVINNYLKVNIPFSELGFRQQLEAIGKSILGDEFCLIKGTTEFWLSQDFILSNQRNVPKSRTCRTTHYYLDGFKGQEPTYRPVKHGWETWLVALNQQPKSAFSQYTKWLKLVADRRDPSKVIKVPKTREFEKSNHQFESLVLSPKPPFFR